MSTDDADLGGHGAGRERAAGAAGQPPDVPDLAAPRAEIDRLQDRLAQTEARERLLSDELQHRVRNMLAMIRSIARQTWEAGASQQSYAQHFQGRLDAIARHQAYLGGARAPGADIEDILRDELLQTHSLDGPRCSLSGPPIRLHYKQAEFFGLAVHELATNAIKFGAFAQGGSLAVDWWADDAQLQFRWTETGVTVASQAPRPSGFGRQLIEQGLPYQLDAKTSFDLRPGGLACSITLSLPDPQTATGADPERPRAEAALLPNDTEPLA